jgi:hypothetical protein
MLQYESSFRRLYVSGSVGYGKAHLLVALVCLLIKGKRVVYIPDCAALVMKPILTLRAALFPVFSGEPKIIEKSMAVDGVTQVIRIIQDYENGSLYFVIDQANALDMAATTNRQAELRDYLWELCGNQYAVYSASGNYLEGIMNDTRQRQELRIPLFGGLSEAKQVTYWKHLKLLTSRFLSSNHIL